VREWKQSLHEQPLSTLAVWKQFRTRTNLPRLWRTLRSADEWRNPASGVDRKQPLSKRDLETREGGESLWIKELTGWEDRDLERSQKTDVAVKRLL
jgi:hypothetical protein